MTRTLFLIAIILFPFFSQAQSSKFFVEMNGGIDFSIGNMGMRDNNGGIMDGLNSTPFPSYSYNIAAGYSISQSQ